LRWARFQAPSSTSLRLRDHRRTALPSAVRIEVCHTNGSCVAPRCSATLLAAHGGVHARRGDETWCWSRWLSCVLPFWHVDETCRWHPSVVGERHHRTAVQDGRPWCTDPAAREGRPGTRSASERTQLQAHQAGKTEGRGAGCSAARSSMVSSHQRRPPRAAMGRHCALRAPTLTAFAALRPACPPRVGRRRLGAGPSADWRLLFPFSKRKQVVVDTPPVGHLAPRSSGRARGRRCANGPSIDAGAQRAPRRGRRALVLNSGEPPALAETPGDARATTRSLASRSEPCVTLSDAAGIAALVANGPPCALRHIVQWQMSNRPPVPHRGRVARSRHRQLAVYWGWRS